MMIILGLGAVALVLGGIVQIAEVFTEGAELLRHSDTKISVENKNIPGVRGTVWVRYDAEGNPYCLLDEADPSVRVLLGKGGVTALPDTVWSHVEGPAVTWPDTAQAAATSGAVS